VRRRSRGQRRGSTPHVFVPLQGRERDPALMRFAVAVLASWAALATPAASPGFQPPNRTREAMEAVSAGEAPFVVYGTQDSRSLGALRERAYWIAARLLRADSSRVIADRMLAPSAARGALILI